MVREAVLIMESGSKLNKRKQHKRRLERRRRCRMKESFQELASLLPEARKRVGEGQQLQQTMILQLTIDYIRSAQFLLRQEDTILQPWNSRISVPFYQYACTCHHCVNQFYQPTSATEYHGEAASLNQNKEFEHQVATSSNQFFQLCPEFSQRSSLAFSETENLIPIDKGDQLGDEATGETEIAYTPPIMGLISLCNSIPSAHVSESAVKVENRSMCAEVYRSDSASIPQQTIPHQNPLEAHRAVSTGAPTCNKSRAAFWNPGVCKIET
ncbi:uncharacterized protein LOC122960188 [Acropora millepora]|uniref:uncharacterized protein LOC122960188 n=1 Tax=Acropora millepora TaxID=45264 RepID=UPI001CF3B981|nr:uncharacterized protein LOC122960188 [Acropora millepora]